MQLSKRSLSRRLQEFVLSSHIEYASNLCSHFWLTVFALSCVTIFLPIYLTILLIGAIAAGASWYIQKRKNKYLDRGGNMSVREAYSLMLKLGFYHGKYPDVYPDYYKIGGCGGYDNNKRKIMLSAWRGAHDDWYELLEKHCKRVSEKFKSSSSKVAAFEAKQYFVSLIPTAYWTLAICISLLVPAYIGGLSYCDDGSIVIGIGVFIVFMLASVIMSFILYYGGETPNPGMINKFVKQNGKELEDDVFISYLKAAKNKMCPIIEWTD